MLTHGRRCQSGVPWPKKQKRQQQKRNILFCNLSGFPSITLDMLLWPPMNPSWKWPTWAQRPVVHSQEVVLVWGRVRWRVSDRCWREISYIKTDDQSWVFTNGCVWLNINVVNWSPVFRACYCVWPSFLWSSVLCCHKKKR